MEAIHSLGPLSVQKNSDENLGFLLTNKKGSYCSFFNTPSSRYQGLFYFDKKTMRMYKFIENIEIAGSNKVSSLKNMFYFAERRKGNAAESFLMPKGFSSLIYELSSVNDIDLMLDCKDTYDNREFGRHYEIFEESNCICVKFTKKTDKREDKNDGEEEFVLYLAIKSNINAYERNNKWIERHYSWDEERNSKPFRRYVYNALRLKGSKFVFSMSKNKNKAIAECNHVFDSANELMSKEKSYFMEFLKCNPLKNLFNQEIKDEIKLAYINALNSLDKLTVNSKDNFGIFAGLPWFFQFWARDALISLKALSKINNEISKKILFDYFAKISDDGRLQNLIGNHKLKNSGNADAHGWLFFRCKDMVEKTNKNKEIINSIKKSINTIKSNKNYNSPKIRVHLKKYNLILHRKDKEYHKLLYDIESSLEKSINGLLKFHTRDGFEINEKLETWMDTEFEDDNRKGVRIEIQALRLGMYKLLHELMQNPKYKILENALKTKLKQDFWNGKFLADGLNDFTVRPNPFIAAYVYPELLTKKEWEICFENALKQLWLDWGGLATIDKNNPLFTETDTGEDVKSYHRGNSWFWINNLAALTLNKTNKIKFKKIIKKIIEASTEEILWKGCIGCHSELSPAKQLESRGCFNQAWSNAMYIELIDGVFG